MHVQNLDPFSLSFGEDDTKTICHLIYLFKCPVEASYSSSLGIIIIRYELGTRGPRVNQVRVSDSLTTAHNLIL